jgi:hypothetical protein
MWWEVFDECTPAQKVRLLVEIGGSIKDLYDRNVTRNAEEDDPALWSDKDLTDHMMAAARAREREDEDSDVESDFAI